MAKKRTAQVLAKKKEFFFNSGGPTNNPPDATKPSGKVKQIPNNATIDTVGPSASTDDDICLSLNTITGTDSDRQKTAKREQQSKLNRKEKKKLLTEKRIADFKQNEHLLLEPKRKAPKPQKAEKATTQQPLAKPDPPKKKNIHSLFANNPPVPIVGQRLVKPVNEVLFTGVAMNSIGLHEHAVKNLADILRITELTTVQQRTIPVVLSGRDVLVRSQTGSGKTLAYALPIVQKLQAIRPKLTRTSGIQAIVIVPTRELAIQCYELFVKLLKPYTWIVSGYITGGEKRKSEKARLRKGINILVGTPGRLCDHLLHTESLKLDQVKLLVLDEADRLFELGYEKDVKKIVDALNVPSMVKNPFAGAAAIASVDDKNMQSMLLSATLTAAVRQLAGLALKEPLYIDTSDVTESEKLKTNTFGADVDGDAEADDKIVIPATVKQTYVMVPPKLRLVTLVGMIAGEKKPSKLLVFLATDQLVDFHHDLMVETLTEKVMDDEDGDTKGRLIDSDADDEDMEYDEEELAEKVERMMKRGDGSDDTGPAILKDVRFFK